MATGKRLKKAVEGIERTKLYPLADAVKLVKERATAKFDETIEIAMNLGVDPRHADQMVRGVCNLPNGSGSDIARPPCSRVGPRPRKRRRPGPMSSVPKTSSNRSRAARSISTSALRRPT